MKNKQKPPLLIEIHLIDILNSLIRLYILCTQADKITSVGIERCDEVIFLAKKSELDEFSVEVGRRIYHLRKQRGLTQAQVADRANISHKFFSSVERREKGMSAKTAVKLANALETSADYLLTGAVKSLDDYGISQWASFLSERKAYHLREVIRNCLLLYGSEDTQENTEETE